MARLPPEVEALMSLPGAAARPAAKPQPASQRGPVAQRHDVPRCECCGAMADPDPAASGRTRLLCEPCASFECERCQTERVIESDEDGEVCFEDLTDGD